jgi:hypothetical protein
VTIVQNTSKQSQLGNKLECFVKFACFCHNALRINNYKYVCPGKTLSLSLFLTISLLLQQPVDRLLNPLSSPVAFVWAIWLLSLWSIMVM